MIIDIEPELKNILQNEANAEFNEKKCEIEEVISSNTDEAWKYVLKAYLKEFLALYWPLAYSNIDWSRGYEFLEQELMQINKPRRKEKRILDTLVKVWHKNGSEQMLLLHLEIQSREEEDFDERIYIYNYRIFDKHDHQCKVASMAILIDTNKKWRPTEYYHELWGCSITMKFPILKLLDYKAREKELLNSKNPFEVIMGAQLKAIGIRNKKQRLICKKTIIKTLYERGFGREEIMNIGRFLDGVFPLSKIDRLSYNDFVQEIEEGLNMGYLTTFEESGMEKGLEKGRSSLLIDLLEMKYNSLSKDYIQKINSADSETVNKWAKKFLFCSNIDQIFED